MSESSNSTGGSGHRSEAAAEPARRNVLVAVLAVVIGAFVSVVPIIPGLAVLTDPLRRKKKSGGKAIRITTLEALQASELPQRFQVIDERRDAWNKYPPEPIDALFLVPQGDGKPPKAYSATCPHLGCAVDFKDVTGEYQCPCHTSAFAVDGQPLYGPSPRGLDELQVEIRNDTEVWVLYQRFQIGTTKKIEA
jgi:Rieske Fe-S protein